MTTIHLFTSNKRLEHWRDGWNEENGTEDIRKPQRRDRIEFNNGDVFLLVAVQTRNDLDKLRGITVDEFEYYDGLDVTDAFWEAVENRKMIMRPRAVSA
jgi:hypothetical protein